jgi:hypothetical protein
MLPWDQVPPERRAIGDLATPLDDELGLMNVHLAVWMARDDSKADASVTRAGKQVMDSIDAMLRQLYQLRARMVAERREDQDTAAARADALLERARQAAACPDHRPVLDSAVGWYCPACGSDAPPDGSKTDGGQP